MFNTSQPSFIISLIEQRIREEVQDEGRKAVDAFASRLEADIEKLGVRVPMAMRDLVELVRTKHIDNMVNKRIVELVEHLVQGEPASSPAAPPATAGRKPSARAAGLKEHLRAAVEVEAQAFLGAHVQVTNLVIEFANDAAREYDRVSVDGAVRHSAVCS